MKPIRHILSLGCSNGKFNTIRKTSLMRRRVPHAFGHYFQKHSFGEGGSFAMRAASNRVSLPIITAGVIHIELM